METNKLIQYASAVINEKINECTIFKAHIWFKLKSKVPFFVSLVLVRESKEFLLEKRKLGMLRLCDMTSFQRRR